MTHVEVLSGDITQVSAEALITAINSEGMWFGGIDGAIRRCAGGVFHSQAALNPLSDGETVFAPSERKHGGSFESVLFVVDDLRRPLCDIVAIALQEAERLRLSSVTLPTIRTGVMAGIYEPTVRAALDEMATAILQFVATSPQMRQISVVVYNDETSMQHLKKVLQVS